MHTGYQVFTSTAQPAFTIEVTKHRSIPIHMELCISQPQKGGQNRDRVAEKFRPLPSPAFDALHRQPEHIKLTLLFLTRQSRRRALQNTHKYRVFKDCFSAVFCTFLPASGPTIPWPLWSRYFLSVFLWRFFESSLITMAPSEWHMVVNFPGTLWDGVTVGFPILVYVLKKLSYWSIHVKNYQAAEPRRILHTSSLVPCLPLRLKLQGMEK